MVVRQQYHMPMNDPRYLAMSDIQIMTEYYSITSWNHIVKHGKPPDIATTDMFDDLVEAMEQGMVDEDVIFGKLDLPLDKELPENPEDL